MNELDTRTIRSSIEKINTLPTIPNVLKKLLKMLENPATSLNDIGHFISHDPIITTKVLRMINSPIYGFPGRIYSVNQAVILLGLNVVKGLLLSVSVYDLMKKVMMGLWEHSLACAITSRLMAKKKGLKEPEESSIAGLLHDIGKVALILQFQGYYETAMSTADKKNIPIMDAEKELFNINHATAGEWMAEKWSFPRNLIEIIGYHHKPHISRNFPVETSIVHLADILVRGRGFGFAGDRTVPPVNETAWALLNLSNDDIKEILKELEESMGMANELFIE
ncbi:MAG TPA: HDOD domain-containing protein [Syntrophorhabdaceae bacterium]|nr:HDOD domain-containing protein [Syntrophorhabdaceae bacterium]